MEARATSTCSTRSARKSSAGSSGSATAGDHSLEPGFWRQKRLAELSPAEWEALCDGCGRCCVLRFHYEDSGEEHVSDVACKLLDCATGACSDYANRKRKVRKCIIFTQRTVGDAKWLPTTCAYRLVHEGKDLFFWHHLRNGGDRQQVHQVGIGVAGRVVNERRGLDPEDRIVEVRAGERG